MAQEHINWSISKWKKVLWSDESIYVLRYKGLQRVWVFDDNNRYNIDLLSETIKHDKKIMVWLFYMVGSW